MHIEDDKHYKHPYSQSKQLVPEAYVAEGHSDKHTPSTKNIELEQDSHTEELVHYKQPV